MLERAAHKMPTVGQTSDETGRTGKLCALEISAASDRLERVTRCQLWVRLFTRPLEGGNVSNSVAHSKSERAALHNAKCGSGLSQGQSNVKQNHFSSNSIANARSERAVPHDASHTRHKSVSNFGLIEGDDAMYKGFCTPSVRFVLF